MEKEANENNNKVSQDQLYDMLVSRELGWQSIIYDLIKTEQLNPWDIDLVVLTKKYIEYIRQFQELEQGAFFISSKVLLAAAILLRIKSEILRENIHDIDELLFEKKENKKYSEIINSAVMVDFAEDEFPEILPRTPLARERKITLQELMSALNRAISTEHRRIKKELVSSKIHRDIDFVMPKHRIDIRQKINEIYQKIKNFFRRKNPEERLTFTAIAGNERDERIACFLPLLHLDNQEKIFLEQEEPFSEINVWLKNKTLQGTHEIKDDADQNNYENEIKDDAD